MNKLTIPNALFKGKHHAEYTWFSVADSLPLLSMSAKQAAQHIVHATQKRRVEVTLTLPAKLLAFFHGVFPQLTIRLLCIVNRLLPAAGQAEGFDRSTGRESETFLSQSFLTTLGRRAAQDYNEDSMELARFFGDLEESDCAEKHLFALSGIVHWNISW